MKDHDYKGMGSHWIESFEFFLSFSRGVFKNCRFCSVSSYDARTAKSLLNTKEFSMFCAGGCYVLYFSEVTHCIHIRLLYSIENIFQKVMVLMWSLMKGE
ncbi:hypothetical protein Mapa_015982 [Marchantia paleacea]|nr:hypothetical protein Mapa_015982 [Marchantia paleacea]